IRLRLCGRRSRVGGQRGLESIERCRNILGQNGARHGAAVPHHLEQLHGRFPEHRETAYIAVEVHQHDTSFSGTECAARVMICFLLAGISLSSFRSVHSAMTSCKSSSKHWISRAALGAWLVVIAFATLVPDADAARMGGGRSFGRQSGNVTRQASPPARDAASPSAAPQQPAQPQPAGNRWLGPIAGLAAGLGIAALLSHFGLGGAFAEAFGSMIMVALLVIAGVFVWRMLRGARSSPQVMRRVEPAYGGDAPVSTTEPRPGAALPGSV